MSKERTQDQLIDELTFAVASVYDHYGPALDANSLKELRYRMSLLTRQFASIRCDVEFLNRAEAFDFHQMIETSGYNFEEFLQQLKEPRHDSQEDGA